MQFRVLSYNIHKCIGGVDRRYDPERVADVIRALQVDVVMMQEVDEGAKRSSGHRQVDVLGELLDLRHRTWFPNVDVRGGGAYGNAILSRYPIVDSANIDLSVKFKKKRSVLHGVLRVRHEDVDRTIHVYNMHLGLAAYERRVQIKTFLASHPFANLHVDAPVVVGGDLNDVYGGLGELLEPAGFRGIERRPRTFPAWAPLRSLDAIFVRGRMDFHRLARCDTTLAKQASDHRPLIAEVALHPLAAPTTPTP